MKRRSRRLRIAKWGSTLSCAALLLLWSLGLAHWRDWSDAYRTWRLSRKITIGMSEQEVRSRLGGWRDIDSLGLGYEETYANDEVVRYDDKGIVIGVGFWKQTFPPVTDAPIFVAIASCGIVAALLWYHDRRRAKPGHCPCGYNLTGNVSGTCPDCGQPFEPKADAP